MKAAKLNPYDQGYNAGQTAASSRNPYRPGTTDYDLWEDGWIDGQASSEEIEDSN